MKQKTAEIFEELYQRYPALRTCESAIFSAYTLLGQSFRAGHKLLTAGNGGSAADAMHIVGELMKGFVLPRKLPETEADKLGAYLANNLQQALPAVSLVGETALSTAYANDIAPDLAFAQQLYGLGQKGDAFLGISTSGNSKNILYAAQVAKAKGIAVIGLTGQSGGRLKELCDVCIAVPNNETYQIQEYHLPVYHALCLALEYEFFGAL